MAGLLGFAAPPATLYALIAGLVVAYLVLVELAKRLFYAELAMPRSRPPARPHRRLQRRASRFSVGGRLAS
jgi:Mg2+-importing ATPase